MVTLFGIPITITGLVNRKRNYPETLIGMIIAAVGSAFICLSFGILSRQEMWPPVLISWVYILLGVLYVKMFQSHRNITVPVPPSLKGFSVASLFLAGISILLFVLAGMAMGFTGQNFAYVILLFSFISWTGAALGISIRWWPRYKTAMILTVLLNILVGLTIFVMASIAGISEPGIPG